MKKLTPVILQQRKNCKLPLYLQIVFLRAVFLFANTSAGWDLPQANCLYPAMVLSQDSFKTPALCQIHFLSYQWVLNVFSVPQGS